MRTSLARTGAGGQSARLDNGLSGAQLLVWHFGEASLYREASGPADARVHLQDTTATAPAIEQGATHAHQT